MRKEELVELAAAFGNALRRSKCLPPPVQALFQKMQPALEAGQLSDEQLLDIGGVGMVFGKIIAEMDSLKEKVENTLSPKDRLRQILVRNRLLAAIRARYPVPDEKHSHVWVWQCIDPRLNSTGLHWLDPRPNVDSMGLPGAALLPAAIEGIDGSALIHPISVGLALKHTDCGLEGFASRAHHPNHRFLRSHIEAARIHPERLKWLMEHPVTKERVESGKLWIVAAQMDTRTMEIKDAHVLNNMPEEGLFYTPVWLDEGLELRQGEPTDKPPAFMILKSG